MAEKESSGFWKARRQFFLIGMLLGMILYLLPYVGVAHCPTATEDLPLRCTIITQFMGVPYTEFVKLLDAIGLVELMGNSPKVLFIPPTIFMLCVAYLFYLIGLTLDLRMDAEDTSEN